MSGAATGRPSNGDVADVAAGWHARIDAAGDVIGGDEIDWDGFAAWLDADPAHRVAYDRIALLDAEIVADADAIAAHLPANDHDDEAGASERSAPKRRTWWALGGGALAAGIAALLVPPMLAGDDDTMTAYATGHDHGRTVTLTDGTLIRLDRDTRLAVADGRERRVRFDGGTAYFDVHHDPARPFTISAGAYEVRDVGTRFDLSSAPGHLAVAVAEGQVAVGLKGSAADPIVAGHRMDIDPASADASMTRVDPQTVASWRDGRLRYQGSPLTLVASDVARYSGTPLEVDPTIADMRFSGVLTIGDGSRLVGQLQKLLPITARRKGRILVLGPRRH
jgi:transmembrane sensor